MPIGSHPQSATRSTAHYGPDKFQQQLLQRVGVSERAPSVFECLMVGIEMHAPGSGPDRAAVQ